MANDPTIKDIDTELKNLIKKITDNLDKKVKTEINPDAILLKGHLMIEGVMQEVISIYDGFPANKQKPNTGDDSANKILEALERCGYLPFRRFNKMSFYEKIQIINKIKMDEIENEKVIAVNCLYALNESRNELAHNIDSNVSESSIDSIGVNLGSKYIMQKYRTGHDGIKDNLLFCLRDIVHQLGFLIYFKISKIRNTTKVSGS